MKILFKEDILCLYYNVSPSMLESVDRIPISIGASCVEGNTLPWATDSVGACEVDRIG